MATSVSASRWRTAWKRAIGRPNWMRSSACSRASSSDLRDAPTSSWPTASCASATASAHATGARPADVDGRRGPRRGRARDRRRAHRRSTSCELSTTTATMATSSPRHDHRRRSSRCREPAHDEARVVDPSRWAPLARSPAAPPTSIRRALARAREATTYSSADEVASASPCSSNRHRHGAAGDRTTARRTSRARRARRRAPRRCAVRWRSARCARTARGPRRPSSVVPEVEQAAGDDVALDLRAAAVDAWRPRVEELACASVRSRRRRRWSRLRGSASATRSNTACSAVASRTLSIEVSGPSRSPLAMRCCVARDRARKA